MSIKIALLKSGEQIISDIQEMILGEGENERVVGYFFIRPCLIGIKKPTTGEANSSLEIKLSSWIPLSKNDKIPITLDWVVTILDPIDKLTEMYEKDVVGNG